MPMRKPGETAPPFTLRSLDGGQVSLESLTSKGPVALAFFKVSCPTCQYTLPFLERLRGHNVVAISQDGPDDTGEFNQAFRITLPTLIDSRREGYPASNAYGLTHVPSLFVIETDGTISQAESGFSRAGLEALGQRLGGSVFTPGEKTPEFRPG